MKAKKGVVRANQLLTNATASKYMNNNEACSKPFCLVQTNDKKTKKKTRRKMKSKHKRVDDLSLVAQSSCTDDNLPISRDSQAVDIVEKHTCCEPSKDPDLICIGSQISLKDKVVGKKKKKSTTRGVSRKKCKRKKEKMTKKLLNGFKGTDFTKLCNQKNLTRCESNENECDKDRGSIKAGSSAELANETKFIYTL